METEGNSHEQDGYDANKDSQQHRSLARNKRFVKVYNDSTLNSKVTLRAEVLWNLATTSVSISAPLARFYIEKMNEWVALHNIKLPASIYKKYCQHCYSIFVPGTNCTSRVKKLDAAGSANRSTNLQNVLQKQAYHSNNDVKNEKFKNIQTIKCFVCSKVSVYPGSEKEPEEQLQQQPISEVALNLKRSLAKATEDTTPIKKQKVELNANTPQKTLPTTPASPSISTPTTTQPTPTITASKSPSELKVNTPQTPLQLQKTTNQSPKPQNNNKNTPNKNTPTNNSGKNKKPSNQPNSNKGGSANKNSSNKKQPNMKQPKPAFGSLGLDNLLQGLQ